MRHFTKTYPISDSNKLSAKTKLKQQNIEVPDSAGEVPPKKTVEPESASLATKGSDKKKQPSTNQIESVVIDSEVRGMFKSALREFERDFESKISAEGFTNWSEDRQRELLSLKDTAISSFGLGKTEEALKLIQLAVKEASLSLEEKQIAFEDALANARTSKDTDDYESAVQYVDNALRLDPDSTEALKLARDIEALPELLKLLQAAKVARAENNLQAEYEMLTSVLNLDPSRTTLRTRVSTLALEFKEAEFSRHVSRGFASLESRRLKEAQASLTSARSIYADRDEIAILDKGIQELKRELETQNLLQDARSAVTADNWELGLELYEKARNIQPDNQIVVEGIAKARTIITLGRQISQHLLAPQRLASGNVATFANDLVNQARVLSEDSPTLDAKAIAAARHSVLIQY